MALKFNSKQEGGKLYNVTDVNFSQIFGKGCPYGGGWYQTGHQ